MKIESYVRMYGEENRTLILDAFKWLEEREPVWGIALNRPEFIEKLIETTKVKETIEQIKARTLDKMRLGMTREEMFEELGDPSAIGNTTRKYKRPIIYAYDDIELWFHENEVSTIYHAPTDTVLEQR